MNTREAKAISVLVGTDHHPFARLIEWADGWAVQHPQDTVTVQFGHSGAPTQAVGHSFLSPDALAELMTSSDIVVAHGGPATISGARAAGHLPLVLARDPGLGEHVDDHQQRFARWSDHKSLVTRVVSVRELQDRVSALVQDRTGTRTDTAAGAHQAGDVASQIPNLLTKARTSVNRASPGAPVVLYISGVTSAVLTSSLSLRSDFSALGRADGIVILGEVRQLWTRGIADNARCVCGVPFSECQFWQGIGEVAFGGWNQVDVADVKRLGDLIESAGNLLLGVLPFETPELRHRLAEYSYYYQAVFRAVQEASGAKVLVCCGEDPILAFALSHNREIDLRILYLTGQTVRLPQRLTGPGQLSVRWLSSRVGAQVLRLRHVPRTTLARGQFLDDATGALHLIRQQLELPDSGQTSDSPRPPHPILNAPVQ